MSPHHAGAAQDPVPTPLASPRGYAALIVGLAVFLIAMILFRVPFRGYLVEARLAGPSGEVDLRHARVWLTAAGESAKMQVAVASEGDHAEIRLQTVQERNTDARQRLDQLSRRFLMSYVPRQQASRREGRLAELQSALRLSKQEEDAARDRLELVRRQLARTEQISRPVPPANPVAIAPPAQPKSPLQLRLESAKAELAKIVATFSDEHPQVISLRSQIAQMEAELGSPADPSANAPSSDDTLDQPPQLHSASSGASQATWFVSAGDSDLASAESAWQTALRDRQWAETQLQTSLASVSTGVTWEATPAKALARIGGTPRMTTFLAAILVALLAGGGIFAASASLTRRPIESTDQLSGLLSLPVVGNAPAGRPTQPSRLLWLRPLAVRGTIRASELAILAIILICLANVATDWTLIPQLPSDPFGVLSEIADRIL